MTSVRVFELGSCGPFPPLSDPLEPPRPRSSVPSGPRRRGVWRPGGRSGRRGSGRAGARPSGTPGYPPRRSLSSDRTPSPSVSLARPLGPATGARRPTGFPGPVCRAGGDRGTAEGGIHAKCVCRGGVWTADRWRPQASVAEAACRADALKARHEQAGGAGARQKGSGSTGCPKRNSTRICFLGLFPSFLQGCAFLRAPKTTRRSRTGGTNFARLFLIPRTSQCTDEPKNSATDT